MTMFNIDHINMNLNGTTQREILSSLASLAKSQDIVSDEDTLVQDYLEREKESTTGFGNGVAIPHARTNNVKTTAILFGRSSSDVEWDSLDGKPVNTFISLLVPNDQGDTHLKLLAKLSRQLVHKDFVSILKTGTKEEVFEAINNVLEN
ncbi:PTS fructose transporter subunit IIA [Companilactobacillus sp. HBUAS56275]|jgi:PTS system, fructose subfamily, IIA component|uniref:PTS fructose transporter subunit IIA n=1 Tax=Candidatus Companilactobacillus pullicola TaxID=2838523 RepID=A0A9D2CP44_9LACO|nr:PTS fructose transporter subunit IIA [Candidatus Companilactobacillus pullicola]